MLLSLTFLIDKPVSNCKTSKPTENEPSEDPGLLELIVSVY